jgi:hypothetical protein
MCVAIVLCATLFVMSYRFHTLISLFELSALQVQPATGGNRGPRAHALSDTCFLWFPLIAQLRVKCKRTPSETDGRLTRGHAATS